MPDSPGWPGAIDSGGASRPELPGWQAFSPRRRRSALTAAGCRAQPGGIAASYAVIKPWLAQNLPIFSRRMHSLAQIAIDPDGPASATVAAYFHNPMVLPQRHGKPDLIDRH
jgi:hypothetical protein